uniref:tetratricopeptide repeat protein n=1 Tax=Alistipes sp. TaxID=1872444 RepID=UPI0040568A10
MKRWVRIILVVIALVTAWPTQGQYNREYFFWMGRRHMMEQQYQEAIRTLNILLRADPEAYEGYFWRGIAKYQLGDLLGADADFSIALEKNPVFTIAYTYRAITRSRLGNYDDALQDFQEAIDLRPDLPNPYYSRGITRLLNQQFEEAIEDFDQFILQENKVADAYLNRGVAYLYLKDTLRAYENFDTAIRTNREYPESYNRRGALYLEQERYAEAEADFDRAIACDSTYLRSYFNRALVYSRTYRPMQSLQDLDRVIALDSTSSLGYYNRAIIRSQIGDYNRALEDYNRVAYYSPENVLVYYNRGALHTRLGNIDEALSDFSRAITLYPDFANAYLSRSHLYRLKGEMRAARADSEEAERKIAAYRSRLSDTTYSIYADTTQHFESLLSFDSKLSSVGFERITRSENGNELKLIPLFKFTFTRPDSILVALRGVYHAQRVNDFLKRIGEPALFLTHGGSSLEPDSLVALDRDFAQKVNHGGGWEELFCRGITQSLIKQYTNAVNSYSQAIEKNPSNPFLYLNRSTTRAEMIDFISSIDNAYQRITIDNDPALQLQNSTQRTYDYDEAIADLNKVIKLYPDFAYAWYNRANLMARSGKFPEAYEDYTQAIALNPQFAEAYFNRGLVQIFMKDTRKGCLDLSKAGELGIEQAYELLQHYARPEHN